MRTLAAEEFAVRLEDRDLEGWLAKEVVVDPGTAALLFLENKYDRTLPPGKHQLSSVLSGLFGGGGKKKVVLVRAGDSPFWFSLTRLLTKDPFYVNLDTRLLLKLRPGGEALFNTNLLASRLALATVEMKSLVYSSTQDAAQAAIGKHPVQELADKLELKQELSLETETYLKESLDRYGLAFAGLELANYRCEATDKTSQQKVEVALQITEQEAKLQGRKRLFEVYTQQEIQAISEEIEKVALFEKRAQLWERMRRSLNVDTMNEIKSAQELEDFMRGTDRDKLLKERDFEEFKKTLAESGQDRELARAQLLRLGELERDYEWKRKDLTIRTDLSRQQVEAEVGLERLRMEQQMQAELRRVELELEQSRRREDYRRSEAALDAAAARERELAQTKLQVDAQGLARDSRRLDAEISLALQEKRQAQERLHQAEVQGLDVEKRQKQMEQDLHRDEAALNIKLQELRELHQQELEKMGVMGGLSVHALIAVSGSDRAPLLADLAKTQAMKDFSPEQILAMAAEKSPQVATAVAEMAGKARSQEDRAFYERLLSEQKESASAMRQTYQEFAKTTQEMFAKALETQAQVAQAFAGRVAAPQPAPVLHAPAAPQVPTAQRMTCRRCQADAPAGTRFCPNCGEVLVRWAGAP